jgi:HK97 gp10 family phage protein
VAANAGLSVQVRGLAELQRTFKRIGGDLPRNTRKALKEIADPIRAKAQANIQHKTGRHSKDGPLKVRISTTQKGVSVYSNEVYARIQDQGGRVGHGAIITRASASRYMTKAVQQSKGDVERALNDLGNRIANEFES